MAVGTIFEAFSITHAAILDPTTGIDDEFGDIYGVRSGSVDPDMDSYENTGDDDVLSIWNWLNKATIAVTSGYISAKMVALMTGSKLTSSGTGDDIIYSLPLWETRQMNTQPRPLLVRMPSKDENGVPRSLDFVFYKVQFSPITFDGPSYKEGLVVNYTGTALKSSVDHRGNPVLDSQTGLPTKSVGEIINRPA